MSDVSLDQIISGYNLSSINENFNKIKNAINREMIHLIGGNNTMRQSLDMDSNRVFNLVEATTPSEPVTLSQFDDFAGEIVAIKREIIILDHRVDGLDVKVAVINQKLPTLMPRGAGSANPFLGDLHVGSSSAPMNAFIWRDLIVRGLAGTGDRPILVNSDGKLIVDTSVPKEAVLLNPAGDQTIVGDHTLKLTNLDSVSVTVDSLSGTGGGDRIVVANNAGMLILSGHNYLKLTGGRLSGLLTTEDITINGHATHVLPPIEDSHLANKRYVDDNAHGGAYLPLAGGTLTGQVSQAIAPTDAAHLANKEYVDSASHGGDYVVKTPTSDQTIAGNYALILSTLRIGGVGSQAAPPTSPSHLVNKEYVDSRIHVGNYVVKDPSSDQAVVGNYALTVGDAGTKVTLKSGAVVSDVLTGTGSRPLVADPSGKIISDSTTVPVVVLTSQLTNLGGSTREGLVPKLNSTGFISYSMLNLTDTGGTQAHRSKIVKLDYAGFVNTNMLHSTDVGGAGKYRSNLARLNSTGFINPSMLHVTATGGTTSHHGEIVILDSAGFIDYSMLRVTDTGGTAAQAGLIPRLDTGGLISPSMLSISGMSFVGGADFTAQIPAGVHASGEYYFNTASAEGMIHSSWTGASGLVEPNDLIMFDGTIWHIAAANTDLALYLPLTAGNTKPLVGDLHVGTTAAPKNVETWGKLSSGTGISATAMVTGRNNTTAVSVFAASGDDTHGVLSSMYRAKSASATTDVINGYICVNSAGTQTFSASMNGTIASRPLAGTGQRLVWANAAGELTQGSGATVPWLPLTGGTLTGPVTNNWAQPYTNWQNSTAGLRITAQSVTGDILFQRLHGDGSYHNSAIRFFSGGTVTIFHDGVEVLNTLATGIAITGQAVQPDAPTDDAHLSNKKYVDGLVAGEVAKYLPLTGGVLTGQVSQAIAPTDNAHLVNKAYVDTHTGGNYLPLTGGTLTGQVSQAIAPTANAHLVNKAYVDTHTGGSYLPLTGGTLTGNLNLHRVGGDTQISIGAGPGDSILRGKGAGGFEIVRSIEGLEKGPWIQCTKEGAVNLFYKDSKKLRTDVNGVYVDSNIYVDRPLASTSGSVSVFSNDGGGVRLANTFAGTGAIEQVSGVGAWVQSWATFDPAAGVNLRYANAEKFKTTPTGISVKGDIVSGDSTSRPQRAISVGNSGGRLVLRSAMTPGMVELSTANADGSSEKHFMTAYADNRVALYFNGSTRLATTSGGVKISGNLEVPKGSAAAPSLYGVGKGGIYFEPEGLSIAASYGRVANFTATSASFSTQITSTGLWLKLPSWDNGGQAIDHPGITSAAFKKMITFRISSTTNVLGSIQSNATTTKLVPTSDPRLKSTFTTPTPADAWAKFDSLYNTFGEFTWLAHGGSEYGFNAHKVIDAGFAHIGFEGDGPRTSDIGDTYTEVIDGETVERQVNPAGVDLTGIVPYLMGVIKDLQNRVSILEA